MVLLFDRVKYTLEIKHQTSDMLYFENPFVKEEYINGTSQFEKYGTSPSYVLDWLLKGDERAKDVEPDYLAFICFSQISNRVFSEHGKNVKDLWNKIHPDISLQLPSVKDIIKASIQQKEYVTLVEALKMCEDQSGTLYDVMRDIHDGKERPGKVCLTNEDGSIRRTD